ncbi:hypothetical protein GCM10007392_01410 [Saccharospirillum salsuginis]|uniref:FAD-binding domain-containing protein n=1 Tax=Saccharospirillum salsuginis TaxID=418750 RepID=A0A918N5F8_9GAMM|nr:hypothetical protein GCM10007392_01410 [Saccharospirillum salsuginis]
MIVGAGPAGSATALALLGAGVDRIVLIDNPKPRPFSIGESAAPDVATKLRLLGCSDNLADLGHTPYQANLSRWGGERRYDDFLHRATGHGWHLDRARFDRDLRDQAADRGATTMRPAKLEHLTFEADQWQLMVQQEQRTHRVRCRYLVDASGRHSALARQLGAERKRIDTLTALAWTVPDGTALSGLSMVESCAEGWWYATCLPNGQGVVSLMSDADLIRQHNLRDSETLRHLWRHSVELKRWLPPSDAASIDPVAFAAHSGFLTQPVGPGWIAVGDAMAAFDPLASAGIANALGDTLAARPAILGWLEQHSLAPAEAYADRANSGIERFLREWLLQYSRETQWLDQPFWQRRRKTHEKAFR